MKILSVSQVYQADQITIEEEAITSADLMERAGTRLCERVLEYLQKKLQTAVQIFCGTGNNGGDGLVLGRLLAKKEYKVDVFIVPAGNRSDDFNRNLIRFEEETGLRPVWLESEKDFPELNSKALLVDAIFGIGLNRSPGGWIKNLILHLNRASGFMIAVDIPSGLFADRATPDPEAVIKADLTLTFQTPKLSFFLPDTAHFAADFEVLDIGLSPQFLEKINPLAEIISLEEAAAFFRKRNRFSHKGSFGHALIAGGSYGKIGAAVLAARAALKTGAGMLTVFIPKCGYSILQTGIPEAMVVTDEEENYISDIKIDFEPAAIGIGMGMGTEKNVLKPVFTQYKKTPFVIDADGLNLISLNKDLLEFLPEHAILTPHPGELKRLIGNWENDFDKLEKVKELSKKYKTGILIKGAYSAIVLGDRLFINSSGNPGMATAGSGDVLSGILTGLLSQGYSVEEAVLFGVFLHGLAGDIAAENLGQESVKAGDIIRFIPDAFKKIRTEFRKQQMTET